MQARGITNQEQADGGTTANMQAVVIDGTIAQITIIIDEERSDQRYVGEV